jgi:hypothetical protein
MNDLDLPPRRTLPPEVRGRIRTRVTPTATPSWTVRHRAPLSVAAAVAVVAAGAVIIGQSVAGTPDDFRAGEVPPTSVTGQTPTYEIQPIPTVDPIPPNAQTTEDLDHCGAVVEASPRAHEFAPRSSWEPVYTVVRGSVRITAFREYGGKPAFCEIDGPTATVSDPSAETTQLAMDGGIDIYALYVGQSGLVAGVAQGVSYLEFGVVHPDPSNGTFAYAKAMPAFQDELFVVDVGGLGEGSKLIVRGKGDSKISAEWAYDPAKVRPVGATGEF